MAQTAPHVTVTIQPNANGNPPGKLADAELHFTDGPLAGLKLVGLERGLVGAGLSVGDAPDQGEQVAGGDGVGRGHDVGRWGEAFGAGQCGVGTGGATDMCDVHRQRRRQPLRRGETAGG